MYRSTSSAVPVVYRSTAVPYMCTAVPVPRRLPVWAAPTRTSMTVPACAGQVAQKCAPTASRGVGGTAVFVALVFHIISPVVMAQDCSGPGNCNTEIGNIACCGNPGGCSWNPGPACPGSPGGSGAPAPSGGIDPGTGLPGSIGTSSATPGGCATQDGALELNPLQDRFLAHSLYARHDTKEETNNQDGKQSVIMTTCGGCQCPDGIPPQTPPSDSAGKCHDGSDPDLTITSCCATGGTCTADLKPCETCCESCRYGYRNTNLDPWPPTHENVADVQESSTQEVCMFDEAEFCPSAGVVWECKDSSSTWVVPGQDTYTSCLSDFASGDARPATFFGFDQWAHPQGCPLSMRTAVALTGATPAVGVSKGWGVETACSNGDPDWLTTAVEQQLPCSDSCAKAILGLWGSCGAMVASSSESMAKELFWRYDEDSEDPVVTVTLQDLQAFVELCSPTDGESCPDGTSINSLLDATSFGDLCLPDGFDTNAMGCPFSCGEGHIDPDNDGNCRPCPRGSYACGEGCSACPTGFDSHAGSESCQACPVPSRCTPERCTHVEGALVCVEGATVCDSLAGVRNIAFCSVCEFGRFPFRNKCLECPSAPGSVLLAVWIVCVVAAACLILFLIWKMSAEVDDANSQYGHLSIMMSVLIPHLQMSTWLLGLDLNWPDFISTIAKWLGDIFFIDIANLATIDCLTDRSTQDKFASFAPDSMVSDNQDDDHDVAIDFDNPGDMAFIKFLLQSMVFWAILSIFILGFCSNGCFSQDRKTHAANAIGTTFCLMFPVLLKSSFSMMDCSAEIPCNIMSEDCGYYLDIAPSTM